MEVEIQHSPKCVLLSFTSGNTPTLSSGFPYHIDDQDICKTVYVIGTWVFLSLVTFLGLPTMI